MRQGGRGSGSCGLGFCGCCRECYLSSRGQADNRSPPVLLQRRCIFGVKEAFEGLQRDLDPLAPGGAAGPGQQRSALEAELAARQDLPRQLTAADRQQEQRIGQNLAVVLAKVRRRACWGRGLLGEGAGAGRHLGALGRRHHTLAEPPSLFLPGPQHPLPRANPVAAAPAAAQRQPTPSLAATAVPVPGLPSGAGSKEG